MTCSRLSNDSSILAIGLDDGWIVFFNPITWKIIYEFSAHNNSIRCLAFNKSGSYLITASDNSHVRVWRTANNVLELELQSPQTHIETMAVVDGGDTVVLNSNTARVYDFTTGKYMKTVKSRTRMVSVNSSLDGIISLDEDDTVTLWDGTMTANAEFIENVRALAVSKDERYMACKIGNTIRVYDIVSENVVYSHKEVDSVDFLTFGEDETEVAYAKGNAVFTVDLKTNRTLVHDVYGIVGIQWT
jgi:polyadenylation factor subunit 2